MKARYIEKEVKRDFLTGVPQDRIILPILSNIYLYELIYSLKN